MTAKLKNRMISWPRRKEVVPGTLNQKYTHIQTKITAFMSPAIIVSIGAVVAVLVTFHKVLWHFFSAGEFALNALIVSTILFSLSCIAGNVVRMRRSAIVLKNIEKVGKKTEITPEDIHDLHHQIHTRGYIINSKNMAMVIDKMAVYGTLAFSSDEARLIKSKVGQRCQHMRQSVGFLGGLMIMMGLLGTFIGLLETIDKVGSAMGGMANIGGGGDAASGGATMDADQMSSFIGSIAAPLQGMALAFSGSLFGIGGSLLVSFFNYLAGQVQNHFIENVARWIDEHVPTSNAAKFDAKGKAAPGAGGGDDLKTWLAVFAEMSHRTHRKLGQLIVVMSHTIKLMIHQKSLNENMSARQNEMAESLNMIRQHVQDFKGQHQDAVTRSEQYLRNVDRTLGTIVADGTSIRETGKTLTEQARSIDGRLTGLGDDIKSSSQLISQEIRSAIANLESQEAITKALTGVVQELNATLASHPKEGRVLDGQLVDGAAKQPDIVINQLVTELNEMIAEISLGNEDQVASMNKKDVLE